jgi:hypothetical protein
MEKYRHEYKHYINTADYYTLRPALSAAMQGDPHAGANGEYGIRSLYFDDYNDAALSDKIAGINRREKYRIRFYDGDTGFIKLEKKIKQCNLCLKYDGELTMKECAKIFRGDISWLKESGSPLMNDFYVAMRSGLLKPKTIVEYTREPYIFTGGNVRVTFDKSVKTGLFSTDFFNPALPLVETLGGGVMIMEVKFDEFLPDFVRGLIQTNERRSSALSKYALCRMYG